MVKISPRSPRGSYTYVLMYIIFYVCRVRSLMSTKCPANIFIYLCTLCRWLKAFAWHTASFPLIVDLRMLKYHLLLGTDTWYVPSNKHQNCHLPPNQQFLPSWQRAHLDFPSCGQHTLWEEGSCEVTLCSNTCYYLQNVCKGSTEGCFLPLHHLSLSERQILKYEVGPVYVCMPSSDMYFMINR